MHRFFIPPSAIDRAAVYFPMAYSRQIASVLRLRAGQRVLVLDNAGNEYDVELEIVAPRTTEGRILASRPALGEPGLYLTLYLGLTQREKFEWMLQKCTEVGASEFVPVVAGRSLVQSPDDSPSRMDRWQRILQEAAEQSGRGRIPRLLPSLHWEDALAHFQNANQPGLIAWEGEKFHPIHAALDTMGNPTDLSVFVGPEGGYSEEEIAQACQAGLVPVSLGARILRMETAAVVAAALVLHEAGEL